MSRASAPNTARLAARLQAAGEDRAGPAVQACAEGLRAAAAALAPGRLGAALTVTRDDDGAAVTAPGFARFVEFGTRVMPARPFLRPAIDQLRADPPSRR